MEKKNRGLREDAETIFKAGLAAVEPSRAVLSHLSLSGDLLSAGDRKLSLDPGGRIFVVGAGKAAGPMAAAVESVLGERIADGVVVTKYGHLHPLERVRLLEAGHPLPDAAGLSASRAVGEILQLAGPKDMVLCLISGGGSALLPAPLEGISLAEKMEITRLLLASGASIDEINTVRKHLSRLKGGGLARLAAPAGLVTLVLSDVVGDRLDVIASGPTVPDPTTFSDALEILTRYDLRASCPRAILAHLERGASGHIPETPKPDDPEFQSALTLLVANNTSAVAAAAERARQLGYRTLILSTTMTGETRDVAAVHGALAREVLSSGNPVPPPACLISGGETTVTIRGKGKGGRNQEFALAAALEIQDMEGALVLSAGTDGTDGPTDAAGAFADGSTVERARTLGLNAVHHLENNDAYPFFEALDDLLVTGPTNTNVMDLRIVLAKRSYPEFSAPG